MTAFLLFVDNLGKALFWPAMAAIVFFAGLAVWNLIMGSRAHYGNEDFVNARSRIKTYGRASLLIAVAYGAIAAVPPPNYDVREVVRYAGVQRVEPPYRELLDRCVRAFGADITADEHNHCHNTAIAASNPPNPYIEVYSNCITKHSVSIVDDAPEGTPAYTPEQVMQGERFAVEERTRRMAFCHQAAMEATRR